MRASAPDAAIILRRVQYTDDLIHTLQLAASQIRPLKDPALGSFKIKEWYCSSQPSHHGWPHMVISDNDKSFVGIKKELKKLVQKERN